MRRRIVSPGESLRGAGGPRLSLRLVVWAGHIVAPILGLWLLVARPHLDVHWEQHSTHFVLTLIAALVSFVLGGRMHWEAARREDARLFLVSLAFTASAGFFALHSLATPDIFVGRNTGFVIATPVGLVIGGVLAAASAVEWSPVAGAALIKRRSLLRFGLAIALLGWLAMTLLMLPPLNQPISAAEARGPLVGLMWAGSALYLLAAARYWQIHRRRPAVMLVSLITAFVLLAEASVATAYGRSWALSWWEWHILLIAAYAFVGYSAFAQWRREGAPTNLFAAISLSQTLRDIQQSYSAALEAVVAAIDDGRPVEPAAVALAERFELSEGQVEVLIRAGGALASERDMIRRQAALVAVGQEASVIRPEQELLERVLSVTAGAFGSDCLRVVLIDDGHVECDPSAGLGFALTVKGKQAGLLEVTRPSREFAERDRALYASFASQLSIALENARLYRQIDVLFRSYLSPDVATSLLADPRQASLGGAIQEVTVLMADLRGFTPFSERSSPDQVVAMLNTYFAILVPAVLAEGGTVVQFVGDALMAMFNAPVRQPDHARRAARAAVAGQAATAGAALRADWPRFRMGINTGPALVGNIGSDDLRCFTAIGDTTNLAARLEAAAPVGGVLISASTLAQLGDGAVVEPLGALQMKGKAAAVETYRLVSLRERMEGGG